MADSSGHKKEDHPFGPRCMMGLWHGASVGESGECHAAKATGRGLKELAATGDFHCEVNEVAGRHFSRLNSIAFGMV